MSGVGGIGGAMSVDRVMAASRADPRTQPGAERAPARRPAAPPRRPRARKPASFADTMTDALKSGQRGPATGRRRCPTAYERGETIDIAKVMLARQQASVGFEATLQVRNKLLSAYKDIMSMPV